MRGVVLGCLCRIGPPLGTELGCFRTWRWTYLAGECWVLVVVVYQTARNTRKNGSLIDHGEAASFAWKFAYLQVGKWGVFVLEHKQT